MTPARRGKAGASPRRAGNIRRCVIPKAAHRTIAPSGTSVAGVMLRFVFAVGAEQALRLSSADSALWPRWVLRHGGPGGQEAPCPSAWVVVLVAVLQRRAPNALGHDTSSALFPVVLAPGESRV